MPLFIQIFSGIDCDGHFKNVRGNVIIRHRTGARRYEYTYVAVARINEVAGFVSAKDTDVLSQADQDRTEDIRILP